MRPRRLADIAFPLVVRRSAYSWDPRAAFHGGAASTEEYLRRFGGNLRYQGRKILDLGCGVGSTCIHLADTGAGRVVGVDISEEAIAFARKNLSERYAHLEDRMEFHAVSSLKDLVDRDFDLIISKDSFEHYADPGGVVTDLAGYLVHGGKLAIGFGPLWKSPRGGHIEHISQLPWAHLIFSETAVMERIQKVTPEGARAPSTYEEYGLNRMTFDRFLSIMESSGLHQECLQVNVHNKRGRVVLCNALRTLPFARELFTFNAYGIWRKEAKVSS